MHDDTYVDWQTIIRNHAEVMTELFPDSAKACEICGNWPCNSGFCRTCRKVDAKAARARDVQRAASNVEAGAPLPTVEALIYSLRQGPAAFDRPENVRRLGDLSQCQLQEVYDRVQRFPLDLRYDGRPAMRWTREQADALLTKWVILHE